MNIPNLPSDNLYKFVTFLGISMVVASVWSMSTRIAELEVATAIVDAKQAAIERISDLEPSMADIIAKHGGINEASVKELEMLAVTLKKAISDSMALNVDDAENGARLQALKSDMFYLKFLYFAGFACAFGGVVAWYFNHQRYQDQIIRREARKA